MLHRLLRVAVAILIRHAHRPPCLQKITGRYRRRNQIERVIAATGRSGATRAPPLLLPVPFCALARERECCRKKRHDRLEAGEQEEKKECPAESAKMRQRCE